MVTDTADGYSYNGWIQLQQTNTAEGDSNKRKAAATHTADGYSYRIGGGEA